MSRSFETGKRSANQEILLGGIYWTLQQLATLIHFLRSFCKPKLSWSSALEFSRFESPLDESKHEQHLESKEIKDDAKDPLIKQKIVPFLRKVCLLLLTQSDTLVHLHYDTSSSMVFSKPSPCVHFPGNHILFRGDRILFMEWSHARRLQRPISANTH